ncbi:MAG TPA: peptidoglycan DD-metalloendopeptidase family protein [Vicinamibacterales bacterium]|nr:peptidoglycan DD-metalloendopeptidase family protein [Vicinamibacterales bacterium]
MGVSTSRFVLCSVVLSSLGVLAGLASGAAQPPDRAHAEALSRRAAERLQALQREADRLTADERTLLGDLRKLELDRQIKAEERQQAAEQAADVSAELEANTERTLKLEAEETKSRPELRARLVDMYKLGQGRYLRLLLSTTDMRQVGQAARTLAALAKIDHDRIVTRERMLHELKNVRASLEQRRRQLNTLRVNAEHAEAALEEAVGARNALIRDIDGRRDLNAQLLGELQAAQQKLQATLRDLASGAPADVAALPIRPFRGDLDWPVVPTGNRRSTRTGTSGVASGLEIDAAEGAAVSVVHEGVVAFADAFGGFGNLVIVEHGVQNFSLYANLLEMSVKKGDRVERGQPIGTVGLAPAGSSELHFELRIDGQSVDPLQWLKKRP